MQTGARKTEIRKLKWSDVDFKTKLIYFRKTKNGQERAVKMSQGLLDLLSKLPRRGEYVFTDDEGRHLSSTRVHRTLMRFHKQNQSDKKWRIHDLRHTFAFNFLMNDGEMYKLQAILGHKTITMAIDLYGQLKASDIDDPSPYPF